MVHFLLDEPLRGFAVEHPFVLKPRCQPFFENSGFAALHRI